MNRLTVAVSALAMLALSVTGATAQGFGAPNPYATNPYATNPYAPHPYGTAPTGTGSNPASHPVQGYTNHNGTYVAPHYSTNPNGMAADNYGTRGNVNPYTGAVGQRSPGY